MKDSEAEDTKLHAHLQHILPYHQILLRDKARNTMFYDALKRHVTRDTRVLDIGAGSGVWAIAAAKLGAKSVTAIEQDSTMIPVIRAHARENGVLEKIEIVHGNSLQINLRHKYELIVTETIGNQAFDEGIIRTMIDARKRFLARNGSIIPQKIALVAAPAHLKTETEMPSGVPVKTDYLESLVFNLPSAVIDKNHLEILAAGVRLLDVDLREIEAEPAQQSLIGRWNLKDLSAANVVALWAESELADGIVLDTFKTTSWPSVVCRFRPLDQEDGELEFNLNFNAKAYTWAVGASSAPGEKLQSYAPVFAYTKLMLDSRHAPRKRKPRKMAAAPD